MKGSACESCRGTGGEGHCPACHGDGIVDVPECKEDLDQEIAQLEEKLAELRARREALK